MIRKPIQAPGDCSTPDCRGAHMPAPTAALRSDRRSSPKLQLQHPETRLCVVALPLQRIASARNPERVGVAQYFPRQIIRCDDRDSLELFQGSPGAAMLADR